MKRKLLLLTCTLLLLSGCGADDDATTASSASEPQPTETAPEYDEEYYLELIPEVCVEIQGLRFDIENTPEVYYLYMSNPEITELTDTYLIAEGILSGEWHATEEAVSVKYYISDSIINSGIAVSEEAVWLTPAIPFSTDILYDLYKEVYICNTDTRIEFTPDNFPIIELDDTYWLDNYGYMGVVTLTDVAGNIYQSPANIPEYVVFDYTSTVNIEEWYWHSSLDSFHINKID